MFNSKDKLIVVLFNCILFSSSQDFKLSSHIDFNNLHTFQDEFPEIYPFGHYNFIDSDRDNELERINHKIPDSISPSFYNLKLIINLDGNLIEMKPFKAHGKVSIIVDCLEETNQIHFHKRDMKIEESTLSVKNLHSRRELRILSQIFDSKNDVYVVVLMEELKTSEKYEISMDFISRVANDRMDGLYLSNYTDPDTREMKYLATTQFESIDARSAFPCFDMPHMKANFEISIGRMEKYNSLSNMNLVRTEPIKEMDGWYWDHYAPTEKMSTYLVAFIVSEFEGEDAGSSPHYDKPIKTWAAKHLIEKHGGLYASKAADNILPFYDAFFDYSYPFPKMDQAAIPHFEAGAMENWGLNTYRIKALLYFPGETSESSRYGLTNTIAHELAHQNFGNLVTCKSWNHLWLNEGFATFVSYYGMKNFAPDLLNKNDWHVRVQSDAMRADENKDVHPLVNLTAITSGMFDRITYSKGASILIMMRNFLGEECLRKGLQLYLKKFAYNSAVQDDLFAILDSTAKNMNVLDESLSIKTILDTWTLQPGYPVIEVNSIRNSTKVLHITQKKFGTNGEPESDVLWYVPLSMTSSMSPQNNLNYWLPNDVQQMEVKHTTELAWVIFNPDSAGYYRVKYNDHLTNLIQNQIARNFKIFRPLTRCKLFDDFFHLGFAKHINITRALDLTTYLENEPEIAVWNTLFNNMRKTFNLFSGTDSSSTIKEYFLPKVESALNKVGWDQIPGEKGAVVIHRSQILATACDMKHPKCLNIANLHFINFMNSRSTYKQIPIDLRSVFLCTGIAQSKSTEESEKRWNFLLESYLSDPEYDRQSHLLLSLTCTREAHLINKLLITVITEESIKKSETLDVFMRTTTNSEGRKVLFAFIQNKFHKLLHYFGTSREIGQIIGALSNYWKTGSELKEFKKFVDLNKIYLGAMKNTVKSIIQNVEANIEWIDYFYDDIKNWFHHTTTARKSTKLQVNSTNSAA